MAVEGNETGSFRNITYTQHAQTRMAERGISKAEVERTVISPFRTVPSHNARLESQGWIERAGKRQLLRVLTEGDVVVLVITVMATSKFEKYGVTP